MLFLPAADDDNLCSLVVFGSLLSRVYFVLFQVLRGENAEEKSVEKTASNRDLDLLPLKSNSNLLTVPFKWRSEVPSCSFWWKFCKPILRSWKEGNVIDCFLVD